MGLAIGVDIGGTKIAAAVVDEVGGLRCGPLTRPTPEGDAGRTIELVTTTVAELRRDHDVSAVGVGVAGFVAADGGEVAFAPNLPSWRHEPLRDRVAERVGLPVTVDNDANTAAWAEYRFGAGRGHRDLVVLTVGTGIGGGLVLGGELYRGRWGYAGEPGHLRVVPKGGLPCGCGQTGCWEQYASGRALTRLARERAEADPEAARTLLELAGGSPPGITGQHVTQVAGSGDELSVGVFTEVGRWLGRGIASLSALLDPGAYVVGGGVADAGELLLGPARAAYADSLTGSGHRPLAEIRAAELGNDAGLVGAADLARQRL